MFTGIIENLGLVKKWQPRSKGGCLTIDTKKKITKIKLGESIAVNGCCLTVIKENGKSLSFDVSDETMRKTSLGTLAKNSLVNLERAMSKHDRFGGHFVLGHVDGVGRIKNIVTHDGSVEFRISFPKKFSTLMIEKGSVTVDGISLTVCDLTTSEFSVYIIPHTLEQTHLGLLKKGNLLNLEFDVLGKYVQRILSVQKG